METSTVRSVRVQMNADVAKYIADMRLAGAETRKAFSGAEMGGFNRELATTERRLGSTTAKTKEYTLAQAVADEKTKRLKDSLRAQAKAMVDAENGTKSLGDGLRRLRIDTLSVNANFTDTNKQLDTFTGRMSAVAKSVAAFGPALVPIGAAAVPAIAGLTMGLGAAAGAAGVAVLAFHGVGDAVKAIDAARLNPTTENLQEMHQALATLGPDGAEFARFIDGLEPQLRALQGSAREGLLPGVQEGITALLPLLPKVEDFIGRIGAEMGHLVTEASHGLLTDPGFQKFTHYLDTEGVPIMDSFARSTGKIASGLVALAADMAPLTGDFLGGFDHAADSFQKWAIGLDKTQGFHDFVAYVEKEGPQVVDLLKTVASTGLSVIEAFAPIGSVTLPALTAVAKVIGLIADSPLGPVVATVVSLNAALSLGTLAVDKLAASWGRVATAAEAAATAEGAASVAGGGSVVAGGIGGRKLPNIATLTATGVGIWGGTKAIDWGLDKTIGKPTVDPNQFDASSIEKIKKSIGYRDDGGISGFMQGIVGHLPNLPFMGNDSNSVKAANQNISTADAGLKDLVRSDQAEKAAAVIAKLGLSAKQTAAEFPQYTAALKKSEAAAEADAGATIKLATSAKGLTAQFRDGTISLNQYRSGLASVHQQALTNFDAVTQFGSAVQAAAKQAKDGASKGLNPFTEAGNKNRQAISQMVQAWNSQPASIQNNIHQYQAMKVKLGEFMSQMGASKSQIADFSKKINQPKTLVVRAEIAQALSGMRDVMAYINQIPRNVHVNVTASTNANLAEASHINGGKGRAGGGYVTALAGPSALPSTLEGDIR